MMTTKSRIKPPRGNRPIARLNRKLDRNLLSYAAVASAAGVGVLALSAAEAEIIYTPAHKHLRINKMLSLDLNHDGIVDFTFNDTHGTWDGVLTIFPNRSANEIWGSKTHFQSRAAASALPRGTRVGPKGKFFPGEKLMASTFYESTGARPALTSCVGPWGSASDRFLGLKFIIKGKPHYGWARLSVSCFEREIKATLTGYAYQTIPNQEIITGRTKGASGVTIPRSLGSLARGVSDRSLQ